MLRCTLATGFEHVEKPCHVAGYVRPRRFLRVAHAGLSSQVHCDVERASGSDFNGDGRGRQLEPSEAEAAVRRQLREPVLLQLRIVVRVDVINAQHLVAALQQAAANVRTNKSSRTSNEYP